jgi:phosphopantothenoylcysteine decarboxylase / phosphopantothenate---cysteine ligase
MHQKKYKQKFIITGGPTREWIDPVRFISNPSTGKMGTALAVLAREFSDDVIYIHGPMHEYDLKILGENHTPVETTNDMRNAVISSIIPDAVIIMSAAPADYAPDHIEKLKIKKGADSINLTLKKTPDILTEIAEIRNSNSSLKNIFVVGFAAETNNIENYAKEKLVSKKLDMLCVNNVLEPGAGFAGDTNIITVYHKNGSIYNFEKMSKNNIAKEILKIISMNIDARFYEK